MTYLVLCVLDEIIKELHVEGNEIVSVDFNS